MGKSEGRYMKVGKNPIESFSLKVGNVEVEFDKDTGLLTYNRRMTNLNINGVTLLGDTPASEGDEEGDNGEEDSTPKPPRKRGKKVADPEVVTE